MKTVNLQKQKLGKLGENYAKSFLISQNYLIIKENFHARCGEIDIIAYDQAAKQLVFVEVKTRISFKFGSIEESITPLKIQKILKTIQKFFISGATHYFKDWRIDLIAVKLNSQSHLIDLQQFKSIFDG
ncbi:MAG: YraN family protein [Patescibacteria group bacterium]